MMNRWTADFSNDPDDNYNLVIEILQDEEYVARIKQTPQGLTIEWYPQKKLLLVPLDWLSKLLIEAQSSLAEKSY